SFSRLANGVVYFGHGVITIYPEPDPFEDDYKKTRKSLDDLDELLDFSFDDVPKFGEVLPPFICKMGKSNRNKKRTMENLNLFYQDIGPSLLCGGYLTQEEAEKEALAVRISQKFALLEEDRHVIETIAYNDKYKKILDEILRDKVELDGKTMKEEKDAVKRIKGEALKEKDDPDAFIFPIRLEGKVNENALADTGSDINTTPYRIYETFGREEMNKIDRGITMINHTEIDDMLRIRLRAAGSDEEIFTYVAWIRAFNLNAPVYAELCQEFYSTYEFDERTSRYKKIKKNDLWLLSMFDARHQNGYANVAWVIVKWMKRKGAGTQKDSKTCCDLDTTTLRDLIDYDGKLIPYDPHLGVPRVSIPRPPRVSMQELYESIGRMEIRQEAIEHIEYRQSYH
nr:hypothetical protein [Tanacetum cinerariifolium]